MFFRQLTKREWALSCLALLVLLSFLVCTYVAKPVIEYIQGLDQQVMIKELKARKNLRLLAKKEGILKEYERVATQWKGNGSLQEEMTNTLKEIEWQARETDLNIVDIKPQLPEEASCRKLFIVVEIEARVDCLTRFMYEISSPSRLLRINKLRLKASGRDKQILEGEMVISRII